MSRYESFVRLYCFFFYSGLFVFAIFSQITWHKTYFIHRILKRQLYVDPDRIWRHLIIKYKNQVSKLRYLAKVLAALILHSYQNKALCFTFCFPLFRSRPMEWSEDYNMLFFKRNASNKYFCSIYETGYVLKPETTKRNERSKPTETSETKPSKRAK